MKKLIIKFFILLKKQKAKKYIFKKLQKCLK